MSQIYTLVPGVIFGSAMLLTLFTSYFFYLSTNGELRKIMINKYLFAALMFGGFTYVSITAGRPLTLWCALLSLPYLYYKSRLVYFLIQSIKK